MPKMVRDFIRRTTGPNQGPLTARKHASFVPTPPAAYQPKKCSGWHRKQSASGRSSPAIWVMPVKDTADQAGVLQEYLDAMSEYRSAARLGSWGEAAQEASKQILKKAPWIGAAYARHPQISAVNRCAN
jgi:hypothetical protein